MVHGKGAFGAHYGNVVKYAVERGFRVIVPDMPLAGTSGPGNLDKPQARTLDDIDIRLMANAESHEDLTRAVRLGADGVGLYRTEFLFLNRREPPGEEEQFAAYRDLALAMNRKPVTLRELATTPLLMREPGSGTRDTVWEVLSQVCQPAAPAADWWCSTCVRGSRVTGPAPWP